MKFSQKDIEDFEHYLEQIKQEMEEYKKLPFYNVYSPVKLGDTTLYESTKRSVEKQKIRLSLFPDDFSGESILEIGTNTGYVLLELKRNNNPGYCLGIEQHEAILRIPSKIAHLEGLQNIEFKSVDMFSEDIDKSVPDTFDNVLFLSVTGPNQDEFFSNDNKGWDLTNFRHYDDFLRVCIKKSCKHIYIEPTPYGTPSNKYVDCNYEYLKNFDSIHKVEYLGQTDLQNRGIFRVTVRG
jgi:SAM-dependent methyltransferase